MSFWFNSYIIDFIVAGLFLLTVLVLYLKYQFTYWTRHGIYQIQPEIPFGNTKNLILKRISLAMGYERIYDHFKKLNLPFAGIYNFTTPEFMPLDPELIKRLLVKDFQHFLDRGIFVEEEIDPLTGNIFSLEGSKWKELRNKLSPAFTSGKMRMMFPTLVACADEMMDIVSDACIKHEPIDFRDLLPRFTTDIIGSCAFGIDCNCLKMPNTDFRKYSQMALAPRGVDKIRVLLSFFFPNVSRFFKIAMIPPIVSKFFIGTVAETVKYREENNIIRKDFMHLCIQLKNFGRINNDDAEPGKLKGDDTVAPVQGLTVNQIAAQCYTFFLAGFETSSTTMTFALYELSKQPEVQDKLRQDIIETLRKHDGEYSYDAIMAMNYLDKVINGMRFGLMEAKVGLSSLLKNYRFTLNPKTEDPLRINASSPLLATAAVWLDVEKVVS
ncbi:Cytochrome P450 6a2 [Carabus blaptoides fortunei]